METMKIATKQELIIYLKLVRTKIDSSITYSEKLLWKKAEIQTMKELNDIEEDWYLELKD